MNKKVLAVLIAAIMLLVTVAFAACGGDKNDTASDTDAALTEAGDDTAETEAGDDAAETVDDLAAITEAGKIVIGITYFEPMNYFDDTNTLTGFETDFATAVAEKLGVTPEFQEIEWDKKVIELKSKSIDCIWNGMTIREELKSELDFSQPYMANKQVAVIRAADAEKYTDLASLAGAKVVAEAGSAGEDAAKADEGLNQDYTGVDAQSSALKEIKAGTSDVAIIDAVMAYSMVGEDTDFSDLTVIDVFDDSANEEYGIGFRTGSNLTEAVNNAMNELAADGTLKAIAEKYGLESRILIGA
ncbi:MAG: transporter substrate-binding domain-containing protein [Clostridia bacterium]|nr:transporter substrate-binding domain-containing protein [Clostridia bacterium]